MNIDEIIRLAFLKYRLSSRKSMNTFIFTQAKNNKLSDEQIDKILNELNKKIIDFENKKKKEIELRENERIKKLINTTIGKV